MEHPITPPPELVQQWWEDKYLGHMPEWVFRHVATEAARWGADQELEACITWVATESLEAAKELRAARRPKPPSLKKVAYDALDTYIYGNPDPKDKERTYNAIRRALEQLDD